MAVVMSVAHEQLHSLSSCIADDTKMTHKGHFTKYWQQEMFSNISADFK